MLYKVYEGRGEDDFCGLDVTKLSGSLTSPGYPMNCPDDMEFWWHFKIAPNMMAGFEFNWFNINCNEDILVVYENGEETDGYGYTEGLIAYRTWDIIYYIS